MLKEAIASKMNGDGAVEDAPVEGAPPSQSAGSSSARKEGGEEDENSQHDDGDFLEMSLDLQQQNRNSLDFDVAHAQHMKRMAANN